MDPSAAQPSSLQNQSPVENKAFLRITAEKMILPETGTLGTIFENLQEDDTWLCRICKCRLKSDGIISHAKSFSHKVLNEKHKEIFRDCKKTLGFAKKDSATYYSLQDALDKVTNSPLIGVEYILEIVYNKAQNARYICTLCSNSKCKPIPHLTSYSHKMRYVMTHFKTAHRHFETEKVRKVKEQHKLVLDKLAWAIQKTHGRLKPERIAFKDFKADKVGTKKRMKKEKHFSESCGPTFETLVVEELAKAETQAMFNAVNNEVSSTQADPFITEVKTEQLRGYEESFAEVEDYADKLEVFHKLAKDIDDEMEIVLIKHMQNPDNHPQYNEEWKHFWKRRYMELQAEGTDTSAYDFKPEWKEFWKERMLEIHDVEIEMKKTELRKMLGLIDDPMSVPIPPVLNKDREVVLMDDDVNSRNTRKSTRSISTLSKDEKYHKSRVPPWSRMDSSCRRESPSSGRYSLMCVNESVNRNQSPSRHSSSSSRRKDSSSGRRYSPVHLIRSPSHGRNSPSRRRDSPFRHIESPTRRRESPVRRREAPAHRRYSPSRHGDSLHRRDSPSRHREVRRECPVRDRSPREDWSQSRKTSDEKSRYVEKSSENIRKRKREDYTDAFNKRRCPSRDEGDVESLVAVLRLLTALEDKLGSLGPRVIDLLSSALVMENKKANSSEELLDNKTNCVLLETVREKLKGQLESGLVDEAQEKVFQKVINNVEFVINEAKRKKLSKRQESTENILLVPGVGVVDKEKISMQIVNTLLAEGRRDITQDELDRMIKVLAKNDNSQSTTTSGYVSNANGLGLSSAKRNEQDSYREAPSSMESKGNDRYSPYPTFGTTSRINKEEYKETKSEENRKIEFGNLQESRLLVNSLLKRDEPSSTVVRSTNNTDQGFLNVNNTFSNHLSASKFADGSKYFSNTGGAFQGSMNKYPLRCNSPLLRDRHSSNQPMPGGSHFEWRGGQSTFLSGRSTDFRGEMTGPRDEIDKFRERLSNYRVGQNAPNFAGNAPSGLETRGDLRSSQSFTRPQTNRTKDDNSRSNTNKFMRRF